MGDKYKRRVSSVSALASAAAIMVILLSCAKEGAKEADQPPQGVDQATPQGTAVEGTARVEAPPPEKIKVEKPEVSRPARLPKVVDLGRGKCIPCKMMAPILEELQKEYQGRAIIEVIDIGEHPEEAKKYAIRLIPTQVFLDADGKEVWRHEGFLAKDAIQAKLGELGVPR